MVFSIQGHHAINCKCAYASVVFCVHKVLGPTSPCKKELDSNEASHSKKISIDNADKNPVTRESKTPTAASNRHELKSHQLKTSRVRINADSVSINLK